MLNWFRKRTSAPASTPAADDLSTLVPRIKVAAFLDVYKQVNAPPSSMPVTEPLAGGLLITYAFDLPDMFKMLNVATMERLGLTPEQLRPIAIENLRKQLPRIGYSDSEPVKKIVTGGNLEACTVLADSYWQNVASNIAGELVAVVPGRDYVIFCSSESAAGLAALREYAAEIMAGEQQHALSDQLIVWRDGRWVDFA